MADGKTQIARANHAKFLLRRRYEPPTLHGFRVIVREPVFELVVKQRRSVDVIGPAVGKRLSCTRWR